MACWSDAKAITLGDAKDIRRRRDESLVKAKKAVKEGKTDEMALVTDLQDMVKGGSSSGEQFKTQLRKWADMRVAMNVRPHDHSLQPDRFILSLANKLRIDIPSKVGGYLRKLHDHSHVDDVFKVFYNIYQASRILFISAIQGYSVIVNSPDEAINEEVEDSQLRKVRLAFAKMQRDLVGTKRKDYPMLRTQKAIDKDKRKEDLKVQRAEAKSMRVH